MPTITRESGLDQLDQKIVSFLTKDARMSWADLASALGISAPAAADRVRRLEQRGVICSYAALVDPARIGVGVTAFVAVQLGRPAVRAAFIKRVRSLDTVMECHHVAGEDDYLLKVRVGSVKELEELVSDRLKSIEGIARTRTAIAMSTVKETPTPPLGGAGHSDSA